MKTGMSDDEFMRTVTYGRNSKLLITMIVIYEHPRDFPDDYVARLHIIGNNRHWPSPRVYIVRNSMEEIHKAIPKDMERMDRLPDDDPCIVEVYV